MNWFFGKKNPDTFFHFKKLMDFFSPKKGFYNTIFNGGKVGRAKDIIMLHTIIVDNGCR